MTQLVDYMIWEKLNQYPLTGLAAQKLDAIRGRFPPLPESVADKKAPQYSAAEGRSVSNMELEIRPYANVEELMNWYEDSITGLDRVVDTIFPNTVANNKRLPDRFKWYRTKLEQLKDEALVSIGAK